VKKELLQWLICPGCSSNLQISSIRREEGEEILVGDLQCEACLEIYPIVGGVPSLFRHPDSRPKDPSDEYQKYFSHLVPDLSDTGARLYGKDLKEEIEDLKLKVGSDLQDLKGQIFLDAGCGLARIAIELSKHCRAVICVDMTADVRRAFELAKGVQNIHFIQADLAHLPLRSGLADFVWCDGALPYVSNFEAALKELCRANKASGKSFAWVYGEDVRWVERMGRFLHFLKLSVRTRFALCKILFFIPALLRVLIRGGSFDESYLGLVQSSVDLSLPNRVNHISEETLRLKALEAELDIEVTTDDLRNIVEITRGL
jgi:ubiquinone/menaquinone biosynthesis C-methylase UbiE/uncharacterized protein YbaR (Trm112 family)